MARINSYPIDADITHSDKWIGTDSGTNKTRNYQASDLAAYLNNYGNIGIAGQINYKFITDISGSRPAGSITFDAGGGNNTAFSGITAIKLSKNNVNNKEILNYLQYIVGDNIIIVKADDPNIFGHYMLVSLTQDSTETDFYDAVVSYQGGNGTLEETEVYGLAYFAKGQADKTNELIFTSNTFATDDGALLYENINGSSMPYIVFSHNLSKKPSISVEQEGSPGQIAMMPIKYIDNNTVRVYFTGTTSGKIYAN